MILTKKKSVFYVNFSSEKLIKYKSRKKKISSDNRFFSTRIENIWEKFGTSLLIMQEITFKTPTHALCHFFYKICEGGWANIPFDIGGQGDSIGKSGIGQHILI